MSKYHFYKHIIVAAFSVIVGLIILYTYFLTSNTSLPKYEDLGKVVGELEWFEDSKYQCKFKLASNSLTLQYLSKAGQKSSVVNALKESKGKIVTAYYENIPYENVISKNRLYTVLEISIENNLIRGYQQTSSAWQSDNKLMPFMGLAFLFGGIYIGFITLKPKA